ncbi:hypothetical protein [Ornithinimicrobium cryptoxanthini]|uniref:Uncharacterized protein n=1 Tax=Ornithinimicrobium cryptoxanthini TaxID=2934161 RepID=A0ABY4YEH8_9MICO|nr:hypothetical protein [Ornithinimicrobium cryptoxanthini]USQ75178.1 hypothetical protein NF557_11095 [Ornithinimicrobium cryptoxanthini]
MSGRHLGASLSAVEVASSILLSACSGNPDIGQTSRTTHGSHPGPIVWDDHLAGLAESLGIADPPEVPVVREVSPSESQAAVDGCLAEEGWMQGNDGWVTVPEDQLEASNLSIYICTAQYPIRPEFLSPLTDRQFARLYDHWITETLPCAQRNGVSVDLDAVPTKETFLQDPYSWTLFSLLMPQLVSMEEAGAIASVDSFLTDVCPGPDEWELRDLVPPED